MEINLTLLYLTIGGISNSPIAISNPNFSPISYTFRNIKANKIFNSFFYRSCQNSGKNYFLFRNSVFSHVLNTAIKITSMELNDFIYTTQITIAASNSVNLDVKNCCFFEASSTDEDSEHQNGGAILIVWMWCQLTITNTVFTKCSSSFNGGAIYSDGSTISLTNSIFSGCHSINTGGAIYFNKISNDASHQYFYVNQTLFTHNTCQQTPLNINITYIVGVFGANFTYNSNMEHNDQSSATQYSSALQFSNIEKNQVVYFKHTNLIGNDGDVLIDFDTKNDDITNVNIIHNVNLNFFFHYSALNNILSFKNIAFYGNSPRSKSDVIKMTNDVNVNNAKFTNCIFDFDQTKFSQILNGCQQEGGRFVTQMETFELEGNFIKPTKCFISTDTFTGSAVFSNSKVFTKSSPFTLSSYFTESQKFSPSSNFSPSSQFSKSSIFSSSQKFSLSSYFHSSTFSKSSILSLPLAVPSASNTLPTNTFTPSNPFTPSNFFTPNRTRVPDPKDIFHQADVHGRSDIFSKEELKKAAAPASISLVFIIVSVVLSILYIKRKMHEVRNPEDIPDFESMNDEMDTDTEEYSYSYYTYSYVTIDKDICDCEYEYYSPSQLNSKTITYISESSLSSGDCSPLFSTESDEDYN